MHDSIKCQTMPRRGHNPKTQPGNKKHQTVTPGTRSSQARRILSGALALLLVLQLVLAGLAPQAAQAAPSELPLQLQAVCHGADSAVQLPQQDAPQCPLPCCMLCCSSAHGGAWAPPLAPAATLGAPLCADRARGAPTVVPFATRPQLLQPPLRGPPLIS